MILKELVEYLSLKKIYIRPIMILFHIFVQPSGYYTYYK